MGDNPPFDDRRGLKKDAPIFCQKTSNQRGQLVKGHAKLQKKWQKMARKHHKSTFARAKMIKDITARHYEEGNQARCYKSVWRNYIYPQFQICYRTYLTYIGVTPPPEEPKRPTLFDFVGENL